MHEKRGAATRIGRQAERERSIALVRRDPIHRNTARMTAAAGGPFAVSIHASLQPRSDALLSVSE